MSLELNTMRMIGGAVGSVAGASFMSVYQASDTRLDFKNYTTHLMTRGGLFGAVVGGVAGAYPDFALMLILPDTRYQF